jgi:hypothetical protein
MFMRRFCAFYYHNHTVSTFLDRLELVSYFRTLWIMVPIDLTETEREEMEYKMTYGEIESDELEELGGWVTSAMDAGCPETEVAEKHDFVNEPFCYTWERIRSGYNKMPLQIEWVDHQDYEMISTCHDWVMIEDRWGSEEIVF